MTTLRYVTVVAVRIGGGHGRAGGDARSTSTSSRGAGSARRRRGAGAGGPVYYTAQATGKLGILDPATGKVEEIALGPRSAPHGVDRRARWRAVDHRRRTECDRARRSRDAAVRKWPLPADAATPISTR